MSIFLHEYLLLSLPCISEVVGIVFFFQAEDGIRDSSVTGVQTCALPISDAAPKGGRTLSLLFFWLSAIAVLMIVAVPGTDRLGRPLTDEEKKRLGALLRQHDYPGARLVALRFAYKLTRSRTRAQDLMGRVDLRLGPQGRDPSEGPL